MILIIIFTVLIIILRAGLIQLDRTLENTKRKSTRKNKYRNLNIVLTREHFELTKFECWCCQKQ